MKKSEYNAAKYQQSYKQQKKKLYEDHKAANLCVQCGSAVNNTKYVTCKTCRVANNKKAKKHREQKYLENKCLNCDNITINSSLSELCKEKDTSYRKTRYELRKEQRLCVQCGVSLEEENTSIHCIKCKEPQKKRRKEKYHHQKELNLCTNCGDPCLTDSACCTKCAEKNRQYAKEKTKENKIKVVNYYGEVCFCCKESGLDFLTIDHINENGASHRRELSDNTNYSGGKFYAWLIRQGLPSGYQTACFNCNTGKHLNNGICPHQKSSRN